MKKKTNSGLKDTAFSQPSDQHPSTERCKLYQLYLPYQRPPRYNITFGGRCRVEPRPDFVVYSVVQVKRCVALNCTPHPDGSHGPMDKPRQSDSFSGHVEPLGQLGLFSTNMRGRQMYRRAQILITL